MIGNCLTQDTARQWPHTEVDPLIRSHDQKVNIHPLTFRCGSSMFKKWQDAILAAQMNQPPRVPDSKFDGSIRRAASIVEVPLPPPSVSSPSVSSVESISSESEEPIVEDRGTSVSSDESSAKYDGDFVNNRYHGKGKLYDHAGNVVYDGDWANGQRWGQGTSHFADQRGCKWQYTGSFEHDEMTGVGKLTLVDKSETGRLKKSNKVDDKWTIVSYEGMFKTPRHLRVRRKNSDPPMADFPKISPALLKKTILENQKDYVKSVSSSTSSSDDGGKRVTLLIDPRKTMSDTGDVGILDIPLSKIGSNYCGALPHAAPKKKPSKKASSKVGSSSSSSASQQSSSSSGAAERFARTTSFGGSKALVEEYLPHRSRWLRQIDPNLGYQTMHSRFLRGTVVYANGCTYEGAIVNNRPHGRGFMSCPQATLKYDGQWKNGKPHGRGVMEWGAGDKTSKYLGQFVKGTRHGAGAFSSQGGKRYVEGVWKNDSLWSGKNVVVHSDLSLAEKSLFQRYIGDMEEGVFEGEGKVTFPDKSFYTGKFKKSQRSGGRGIMTNNEGKQVLIGTWDEDMPHGRCARMEVPGGFVYTGVLQKGKRQGMGELFKDAKGGIVYEGLWMSDLPSGRGVLHAGDGEYDGEFQNGKRHGKGKFVYKELPAQNGKPRYYDGNWKNDVQEGNGTFMNEHGVVISWGFSKGDVLGSWMASQKKKGGLCGGGAKAPEAFKSPKVEACAVKANDSSYWGPKRVMTSEAVTKTIKEVAGQCPWSSFEAQDFKFHDPPKEKVHRPSRAPLRRPDSITGTTKVKTRPAEVLKVTLHEAKNLPLAGGLGEFTPFARVKLGDKSKDTKPFAGAPGNVALKDSVLRFFFDKKDKRQHVVKVQFWDSSSGKRQFIGEAKIDIEDMVKKNEVSTTREVPLLCAKQPSGSVRLSINLGATDVGDSMSSGSFSSSASFNTRLGSPSAISIAHDPVGDHIKVEIHSAKGLFEVADRMDPVCKVQVGDHQQTTKRDRNGGRNPMWTETFAFPSSTNKKVIFEVLHKDESGKLTSVGKGEVDMKEERLLSEEIKLLRMEKGVEVKAGKLKATVQIGHAG